MSNQSFRKAMSHFATGITIVTTEFDQQIHGMTVNAFMSVSLDPQLITISLDQKTNLYQNADKIERFGVSMLREEQKDISQIFAKQVDQPFHDFTELDQIPVINHALTTLACTVVNRVEAGDHLLLIAEVDDIKLNEGKPIIYYNSQYHTLKDE
ncbi:flavin reductase domain-containing FMN-binding protein [Gracilibacillus halophilus YIM-C55.5]|uniref:Flavin reductase domain-containing FMN-binding protein n=1 Tax=Gracilibacillus halophilus YIM-C55.5 TaxID=1308866 RepID=N4WQR1_9BACI|nr:flavin reductase family protein [Gracilibacillus halophilus]ENH95541.1 flavin reductase domain-containing FMN-binding protein [Gracilibacillus halophilus YIM-C55.5]